MHRVLLLRSAQKALQNIPSELRPRIYSALRALSENPRPPGCKKLRDSSYWRIRVGDYRAVYEINDASRTVTVMRIAHRGEVYR
jgi:mRNA interferase RelE/StbE